MLMKINSFVSVLIPVFNVEKYVEKAVNSIIQQTYDNIEIIIVDDASSDNTYEILKEIAKTDSRIRLFRNEVNQRICKTLNFAFLQSKGQYILRMDGDDLCSPDRLARKLDYLINNKLDIVGCSTLTIDTNDNVIGSFTALDDFNLILKTAKYRSPLQHIWLAKREVYEVLDGYRELSGAEDYDFILRAISNGFSISNIRDFFGYSVRIGRSGNTVSSIGLKQRKLHEYVWRLYVQRKYHKVDDFDVNNLKAQLNISKLSNYLFVMSSRFLTKAILEKNFLFKIFYLICALQSPHQIKFLYNSFVYRLMVK